LKNLVALFSPPRNLHSLSEKAGRVNVPQAWLFLDGLQKSIASSGGNPRCFRMALRPSHEIVVGDPESQTDIGKREKTLHPREHLDMAKRS